MNILDIPWATPSPCTRLGNTMAHTDSPSRYAGVSRCPTNREPNMPKPKARTIVAERAGGDEIPEFTESFRRDMPTHQPGIDAGQITGATFDADLATARQALTAIANFVCYITPLAVADMPSASAHAGPSAIPSDHRYYLAQTALSDQVGQWYPVANVFSVFAIDIVQQQVGRLAGPGGLTLLNCVFHCTPERAEQLNRFFHELRNPGEQALPLSQQRPIVLRQQRDKMLAFSVVVTAKDKIGITKELARICSQHHYNVVSVTSWSYRPKIRHGDNVTVSDDAYCTFQLNIEAAPGTTDDAVRAAFLSLTKNVTAKATTTKEKVIANRVPNHYLALRDEVLLLSPFTDLDLLARQ